jgi:hypothetical protein
MTTETTRAVRPRHRRAAFVWLLVLVISALLGFEAQRAQAADSVTWAAAPADTSVGKDRAHFAYSLAPGTSVTDAIAVVNRSETSIKLRVYASDAFSTPTGGIDLLPAAKKPTDVGAWITMKTQIITLKPQQSAVVPFTLAVPATATPGDHSGGVVTSLITGTNNTAVQLDRRLGSRVYLRVTGDLQPALSVSNVQATYHGTLNPGGSGSTTVSYTVTNTGNVRLAAHQTVRIASVFGALAYSANLKDLPEVLPGDSLTRSATVDGVWPATRMTSSITLQPIASGDQPPINVRQVVGAASLWAWPLGQLIVLIILVAGVFGVLILRRKRALAVQAAVDAAVNQALADSKETTEVSSSVG